jgi:hypothetical protein
VKGKKMSKKILSLVTILALSTQASFAIKIDTVVSEYDYPCTVTVKDVNGNIATRNVAANEQGILPVTQMTNGVYQFTCVNDNTQEIDESTVVVHEDLPNGFVELESGILEVNQEEKKAIQCTFVTDDEIPEIKLTNNSELINFGEENEFYFVNVNQQAFSATFSGLTFNFEMSNNNQVVLKNFSKDGDAAAPVYAAYKPVVAAPVAAGAASVLANANIVITDRQKKKLALFGIK